METYSNNHLNNFQFCPLYLGGIFKQKCKEEKGKFCCKNTKLKKKK